MYAQVYKYKPHFCSIELEQCRHGREEDIHTNIYTCMYIYININPTCVTGSSNNVDMVERQGKRPFFNWISADSEIATVCVSPSCVCLSLSLSLTRSDVRCRFVACALSCRTGAVSRALSLSLSYSLSLSVSFSLCVSLCLSLCRAVLVPPWGLYRMAHRWFSSKCVAARCSVLQCVAMCCSVLQSVAIRCSVLLKGTWMFSSKCVTVRCSALPCVAVRCIVLQCVAVCWSVLQFVAVCCSALLKGTRMLLE